MSKRLALAGPLAALLLAGGCGETLFISISSDGRIEVFISTTNGTLDFRGFSVSVDGGAPSFVASGGRVTLTDLREGIHSVLLSGLGEGCGVVGSNPRSVRVGGEETVSVGFEIRCASRHHHDHPSP